MVHRHLVPIFVFSYILFHISFHFLSFLDLLLICTFLDNFGYRGFYIFSISIPLPLHSSTPFTNVCASDDEGSGQGKICVWVQGSRQGTDGRTDGMTTGTRVSSSTASQRDNGTKGYPYRDLGTPRLGNLGGREGRKEGEHKDRMVRDAWVHNGGRTEQGQEGTQRFDIGSAFCTQEQWGISICERVSFYLGKERIGGVGWGDGSRCAHQSINQPQYCI